MSVGTNSGNAVLRTALGFALCVVAACGTGATAETSSTTTEVTVPEFSPSPSQRSSLEQRLVASWEVKLEPDELVFAGGSVWTKTADGHLIEIDPATNEIVSDIRVDTTTDQFHFCQGLGTDGKTIWVCSAAGTADSRTIDVVRVDVDSKSIVETVAVDKVFEQFHFPVVEDQIWFLSNGGRELVGVDLETNEISDPIDLGFRCFQLAAVGDDLMATCTNDNVVVRVDVDEAAVIDQIPIEKPINIDADDSGVWIARTTEVEVLDPETMEPIYRYTGLGLGLSGEVYLGDGAVWVREEKGFLYRIDPQTHEIVEQISSTDPLSGGSVIVAEGSIWTTAYNDNLVIRLSLEP